MTKKKTVLFHSTFSRLKTGFGANSREVLKYLHLTGKYNVVEFANTIPWGSDAQNHTPWKCYGSLPASQFELQGEQDQGKLRAVGYGHWNIDKVIKEVKPDVYIGVEDAWAFNGFWDKEWFKTIPHAIWTTLDSLPLLKSAVDNIDKIKNFWVWASFAEREFARLGHDKVKTVRGMFDFSKYFPFAEKEKEILKRQAGLEDTLVFGFVFRNQLRKLVGTLLEGFAEFKKKNPKVKAKVLLHTNWSESWDIPAFIKEFGINNDDVITTYYCRACKQIYVVPFHGNGVDCKICKTPKSAANPTVIDSPSQEQLNMVYNLMDAYIHPATSGGLEMPIVEAMLCGLPTSTVNYSFGEDFVNSGCVHSLTFDTYREVGANFIKASPRASSVASFMEKVMKNRAKYAEIGAKGREWVLKEFDNQKTGKFLEDFIDNCPEHNFKFEDEKPQGDVNYPLKDIPDNVEWLKDMYKHILNMDDPDAEGLKNWQTALERGRARSDIHKFFISVAQKENAGKQGQDIRDFIKKTDKKKLVYIMPQSLGDCVISLNVIKQLREDYQGWELYVCTMPNNFMIFEPFMSIIDGGLIPYVGQFMDSFQFWEGTGQNKGLVDVAFQPYLTTQRAPAYTHNGEDKNYLQNERN